ncbi:MAG TPA: MFS transporter [Vicinamibacterales bacterium]|nr:MFS transporter [Vicinamibacterales bacterium]
MVRTRVLGFAFALTAITYLDRICISAAAPFIMRDLSLTALEMSVVFSAFTLAYSLFEVPSGWLGDVRGPHRVLTRIVVWWSAFTMLTALAQGFRSLVVIRFLFGAGEAGAFPNVARTLSRWFPVRERGRAQGVAMLGSRVGGMLSVPLALLVINAWGWRMSFVVFGAVGLVWAVAWQIWYRDRPEDHPGMTASELAWIQQDGTPPPPTPVPWKILFTARNLYAIAVMYFAFGYGLYFYFTWLPTYLIQELGFSTMAGGAFAALPFMLAGAADVSGGWLTDRLSQRYGLRAGRSYLGFVAFFTCGVLLFLSTLIDSAVAKAILLALALASADFGLSAAWAVCSDIAPDHAGAMTGWMNTFGNLGGFIGPLVVGYAIARWQSWTISFYIAAVIYVVGALAWLVIDPTRTLVKERQA